MVVTEDGLRLIRARAALFICHRYEGMDCEPEGPVHPEAGQQVGTAVLDA